MKNKFFTAKTVIFLLLFVVFFAGLFVVSYVQKNFSINADIPFSEPVKQMNAIQKLPISPGTEIPLDKKGTIIIEEGVITDFR